MNKVIVHIWRQDTGITDIAGDPKSLPASELVGIRTVWRDLRESLQGTEQLRVFTEKLTREWAIETGAIEGLYDIDRGVTATLIDQGFRAELISHGSVDRPREFVLKLLRDQKNALEGIFAFVKDERRLSVSYIKELHAALLRSQSTTEAVDESGREFETPLIKGDFKKLPNFPVRDGTEYQYCPPEHVASEMDRLIELHLGHVEKGVPADVQAAWLHHRFSQIHPFQDGNGRVARAIATAVLIKGDLFPLLVTRDTRSAYIESLEKADDGDLTHLIGFIAKSQRGQFQKALGISRSASSSEIGVGSALRSLEQAATAMRQSQGDRLAQANERAEKLLKNIEERLLQIAPEVRRNLLNLDPTAKVSVGENGRRNGGLANMDWDESSWHPGTVILTMEWRTRFASIYFGIHRVGTPFNGTMKCAPFFELWNRYGEDERSMIAPIAEENFLFFATDDPEIMLRRFEPWREDAIRVAILELGRSL